MTYKKGVLMFSLFQNELNRKKSMERPVMDGELLRLHRLLKEEIKVKFSSKLKLYIIDTGSCNACEVELQALFNPLYNVNKVGIEVVYHSSQADIMVLTGLLTENMYPHCREAYQQLKEPKHVVTLGDCPLFHAPFQKSFAIKGEANIHFSTQFHIKGCPPEPKGILRGLLKYITSLESVR